MEWIVEAETLSDFVDNGRYTIKSKPLVRCRDCKHFIQSNASNATVCNKHDGLPYTAYDTDFCSRAEWKDDENYK